jgi:hypothetical protein
MEAGSGGGVYEIRQRWRENRRGFGRAKSPATTGSLRRVAGLSPAGSNRAGRRGCGSRRRSGRRAASRTRARGYGRAFTGKTETYAYQENAYQEDAREEDASQVEAEGLEDLETHRGRTYARRSPLCPPQKGRDVLESGRCRPLAVCGSEAQIDQEGGQGSGGPGRRQVASDQVEEDSSARRHSSRSQSASLTSGTKGDHAERSDWRRCSAAATTFGRRRF